MTDDLNTIRLERIEAEKAADAEYWHSIDNLCSELQRQVLRDHPSRKRRPHPSKLVATPPAAPSWWYRLVCKVRKLRDWVAEVGEIRVDVPDSRQMESRWG